MIRDIINCSRSSTNNQPVAVLSVPLHFYLNCINRNHVNISFSRVAGIQREQCFQTTQLIKPQIILKFLVAVRSIRKFHDYFI